MSKLDDIVNRAYPHADYNMGILPDEPGYEPDFVRRHHDIEAKREQAGQEIKALFKEIVGAYEPVDPENPDFNSGTAFRNELRTELNKAIEAL
jgi:hypothetical protein